MNNTDSAIILPISYRYPATSSSRHPDARRDLPKYRNLPISYSQPYYTPRRVLCGSVINFFSCSTIVV